MIHFTNIPKFKLGTISKADWKAVGRDAMRIIIDRTKAGLDTDRKPFKKYAESTLRQKQKIMQTRGTPGRVNLEDTGEMHRSLTQMDIRGGVELYYADGNRAYIAYLHHFGIRMPKRKHFGLYGVDATRINETVARLQMAANKAAMK